MIKICKNCGPLLPEMIYKNGHCKTCAKKQALEWQQNNNEKRKVTARIWKNNNKEKVKKYRDEYKDRNHQHKLTKDREYGCNYYARNREERKEILLNKKRIEIKNLHNTYIKSKLARKFKTKAKEIPLWMVEVSRPLILIKRKIKEIKNK